MTCRKCTQVLRIVFSILGFVTGISVAIVFGLVYKNYHITAWALVTSLYALLVLRLHSKYMSNEWQDGGVRKLLAYTGLGIAGQISTVISILAYLVIAISEEQKLTPYGPRGFFVTSVWVAMSWKWAFLTTLYSIKYRRLLLNSLPQLNSPINEPTESDPLVVEGSSTMRSYMSS